MTRHCVDKGDELGNTQAEKKDRRSGNMTVSYQRKREFPCQGMPRAQS